MTFQQDSVSATTALIEEPDTKPSSYHNNECDSVQYMSGSIHFPGFKVGEESFDALTIEIPDTLRQAVEYFDEVKNSLPKVESVKSAYFTCDRTYGIFDEADDAEEAARDLGFDSGKFIIRTLLP